MARPLDGVQAKIGHAGEHLDCLRDKLLAFVDPDEPYEVIFREIDREQGVVAGHLHVLREPPLEFGVLVGDIAHDLRSALDHLIYQVAKLSVASPSGTQFPIYSTKEAYWDVPPKGDISPRDRYLDGIPEDHRAFVDREQPYMTVTGPDVERHHLRRLSRLSNRDKHRIVAEAFARPISVRLRLLNGSARVQLFIDKEDTALTDGSRIFVARITERSRPGLQIKVDMQTFPAFGSPPLGYDDLAAIRTHVIGVIERFNPLFV
ncbi:MAG: hypothetical protein ACRDGV_09315 [Candidatus Limnocylindria bacterium]